MFAIESFVTLFLDPLSSQSNDKVAKLLSCTEVFSEQVSISVVFWWEVKQLMLPLRRWD